MPAGYVKPKYKSNAYKAWEAEWRAAPRMRPTDTDHTKMPSRRPVRQANQLVNDALEITNKHNRNRLLEEAAEIYEENGDQDNADDARNLMENEEA